MNKFEIRKKILKKREQKKVKKLIVNIDIILKILKTKRILGKKIGGYYPCNYEIDIMDILKKLKKKKFFYFIT